MIMEKLLNLLATIPSDKVFHALGGVVIFAVFNFISLTVALVAVTLIAAAKELYDYTKPQNHTCDTWDFIATCCGGLLGLLCTFPAHYHF